MARPKTTPAATTDPEITVSLETPKVQDEDTPPVPGAVKTDNGNWEIRA
jgi:hypothetical protein